MNIKKPTALLQLEEKFGYTTFGQMIQGLRTADEVSQVQLAKKMKMSRAMLCDIEKGRRSVNLVKARQFAKAMGYSEVVFAAHVLEDLAREAGYKARIELSAL